MTKGKKRKNKKFIQYYGKDYVEKDQEEKRKREENEDDREAPTRGTKGPM